MPRLTCVEDGASKFWEGETRSATLVVRWGRLGTAGQSKEKVLASPEAAEKELAKLLKEKRGKGYADADDTPSVPVPRVAKNASPHRVITDAGIVVLFDPAHFAEVSDQESWERALVEDADILRHIAAGHLVPLHAGSDGRFDVTIEEVETLEGVPAYRLDVKTDAVLAGLERIHCAPEASLPRLALAPGSYAVAIDLAPRKKDMLRVRIARAAASFEARRAIDPFGAPAKLAAKKAAKPKTAKAASALGREGLIDLALDALVPLADAGDSAAHASLMGIYAFRGEWTKTIHHAGRFLADPSGVYAGNVQDEALGLLLAAGHETRDWDAVLRATPLSHRNARLCAHLRAQAEAGGTLSDPVPEPSAASKLDRAQREAQYASATSDERMGKKTPEQRARQLFVSAVIWELWDVAIARYDGSELAEQDYVLRIARHLAAEGDVAKAWSLIEQAIPLWHVVDNAQVAPVALLIEPTLRRLVTPERAKWILETPRRGNG